MSGYNSYSIKGLEKLIALQNEKISELKKEIDNIGINWTETQIQCHTDEIEKSIQVRKNNLIEIQKELDSRQV